MPVLGAKRKPLFYYQGYCSSLKKRIEAWTRAAVKMERLRKIWDIFWEKKPTGHDDKLNVGEREKKGSKKRVLTGASNWV